MDRFIYKIATQNQWEKARQSGQFDGAPVDLADGFIHFSTAGQMAETAAKHFAGMGDLVLAEIDTNALGPALKYEVSRGGALFPHLYASLPLTAVTREWKLKLDEAGNHVFPSELGA